MSSGEALDLHMTPEAFAAQHAALIGVGHVNKYAYASSSSAARCLAQRGDLIDDFLLSCQALARHIYDGTGSPEGVLTAPIGSVFVRTNGGAGTTLYVKESGTGNTGWVALATASGSSSLVYSGTGSPEGVTTAPQGAIFLRTDGDGQLYRKTTASGNTGWIDFGTNRSGNLTFTGAGSIITLGLTASPGNARFRFLKGGANNQTTMEWLSDDVVQWGVQHDSSENLNVFDNALATIAQFVRAESRLRLVNGVRYGGASGPLELSGSGSPEGSVTAPVGSTYHRTDGGAGTTVYNKESGAGNTGWVAVGVTQGQIVTATGVVVLNKATTDLDTAGSSSAVQVYGYNIVGGTVPAGRILRLTIDGHVSNNDNGNIRGFTYRLNFGGATVWTPSAIHNFTGLTAFVRRPFRVQLELVVQATSLQVITGQISYSPNAAPTTGFGDWTTTSSDIASVIQADTAVNMAADALLEFTVQPNNAVATLHWVRRCAILEML